MTEAHSLKSYVVGLYPQSSLSNTVVEQISFVSPLLKNYFDYFAREALSCLVGCFQVFESCPDRDSFKNMGSNCKNKLTKLSFDRPFSFLDHVLLFFCASM